MVSAQCLYRNSDESIFTTCFKSENEKIAKMSQRKKSSIAIAFIVLLLLYLTQLDLLVAPQHNASNVPKPIRPVYRSNNTIWISMGLCFDETAKILGKSRYPYTEVTPLAIKLWKHFRPDAKIYIKVIYTR